MLTINVSIVVVCHLFIMDLRIASYNMHGFNNGRTQLDSLFNECDLIILQKHWLVTTNINSLINSNVNIFGSAISGILDIDDFALCGGRTDGIGIL